MTQQIKKNLVISALAMTLSASATLVPILSALSAAYPLWEGWIPMLVTIPPLMIMMVSLLVSPLLRIFSRKQISVAGIGLILIAGVAPYFFASFPFLLFSRICMGIGLGFVTTISSSLPAAYFPSGKERDRATGFQAAFSSFGGIAFNFLSGWIGSFYWKGAFLVQLLNILPLVVVTFLMDRASEREISMAASLEITGNTFFYKEGLPIVILAFSCILLTVTFPLNLSGFIEEKAMGTTNLAGIVASINSFLGFVIGFSFPALRKIGKEKTLPFSLLLVSISFLIMSQASRPLLFLFGSSLFGIGTSIIYPSFLTEIYEHIPERSILVVVGMYTVATNIAQFVSPYIVNPLASIFGKDTYHRLVFSGVAVSLLAVIIFIKNQLQKKRLVA